MEKGARDYQAQQASEFDLISNGIKNETDVVTSQAADWETAKANQVASAIMTQYPDLKAIMALTIAWL
jgi:ABC-type sugar transport system substrate-binding protein